ncbi:MAG TPA: hypothetical protein VJ183_19090 [Chloroflexia bacterium]|nr:hypothetical protein [Chloroflexia bacterium]
MMNFIRNQRASGQQQAQASVHSDRVKGGPIVTIEEQPAGKPQASGMSRRLPVPRSRLERIAFWIIGLAVAVVVLVLIVPSLFGAFATALYTSIFVAFLTLSNLRRPSGWANAIIGRKVFPVLHTGDGEIWKLAVVNAMLVFVFAFAFDLLSRPLTPLFAGIVVFGGLIALGIFWGRARRVIGGP